MSGPDFDARRKLEQLDRAELVQLQLDKLNALLDAILPRNRFYATKLAGVERPLNSLESLARIPHTFKDELVTGGRERGLAANMTFAVEQYTRFHRTSGTRGHPLVVLDTALDWQWWVQTWQFVLDAARVDAHDRALLAFSFGPFIGFWSAFDALLARGALAIPGGGLSSLARLELIRAHRVTALFCTPTYALHLAEVAAEHRINLPALNVRCIVVAGEPGGSLPAVRQRIESAWSARVVDHGGATEVGPWGYGDSQQRGLHLVESEFLAEFRSIETGEPAGEGQLAELVLTTLGRTGCPVIRYRTGDLVRPTWAADNTNRWVLLDGGVLGRADDMLIIRGVNVFPSSVEQVLRGFPEVVEYRMTASKAGALDQLSIEVEDRLGQPERIARELHVRLGLKIDVHSVSEGTLPRFEGKGKRFVDQR